MLKINSNISERLLKASQGKHEQNKQQQTKQQQKNTKELKKTCKMTFAEHLEMFTKVKK